MTDYQKKLAEWLVSQGYGWGKFAGSVLKQGWCSEKQHETMLNMKAAIEYRRNNRWQRSSDEGGLGCSDTEAMMSGDYF